MNFILFVIAFGFAHLLHQQILPFNQKSFPYPGLEDQESKCWDTNSKAKFENLLLEISNDKFGKLQLHFSNLTIDSDITLIKLYIFHFSVVRPLDLYFSLEVFAGAASSELATQESLLQ